MKDYYETPNGFKLLKSWSQKDDGTDHCDSIYEANEKIAYKAAEKLMPLLNLKSFSKKYFMEGFAYTSTSNYAAIWQCQTEGFKKGTYNDFRAIALTINSEPIAVYHKLDKNGNNLGTIYEKIH